MKTWNQAIPLLRNDGQKVVANGYPDLRIHCVLGCSVDGLEVQMLHDSRPVEVSAEIKCSLSRHTLGTPSRQVGKEIQLEPTWANLAKLPST